MWNTDRDDLAAHARKPIRTSSAVMPTLQDVHWKQVEAGEFGSKLRYLLKPPSKEFSVGRLRRPRKDGTPHYRHNKRQIRAGTRKKLFRLMRSLYIAELAMAGGEGIAILKKLKHEGLRDYHRRFGWSERRP